MRVEMARILTASQADQAWDLYCLAFAELRVAAAQRHVMNRAEFDGVMADERVGKYLAVEPATGQLAGLATFTNVLEAMPLISPDFFAHRWPELVAQHRVWYLGFFAVAPSFRGRGAFEEVIERMWSEVRVHGGVAALDVCGYNTGLGLPLAIRRTLESLTPQVVSEQVDVQAFWAFQLGASPLTG
jgi:ribosomal protein S18 acetylase RimI-like enzyme